MTAPASPPLSDDAFAQKLRDWWPLAALGAFVAALGAAFVVESRRERARGFVGQLAAADPSPGWRMFEQVVTLGVRDHELERSERGVSSAMRPFHKTFNDAKVLGISPTELAISGRYFGEEVLPVRVGITPDGKARLLDGRRLYMAAKMAGARGILADVVLYDREGDVEASRRVAMGLL